MLIIIIAMIMVVMMIIVANIVEHYVSGIDPSTLDIRSILSNNSLLS